MMNDKNIFFSGVFVMITTKRHFWRDNFVETRNLQDIIERTLSKKDILGRDTEKETFSYQTSHTYISFDGEKITSSWMTQTKVNQTNFDTTARKSIKLAKVNAFIDIGTLLLPSATIHC